MSGELAGMVLRCEKTGKLFFTTKEAELHGEETGLSDFAQVSLTEKIWVCEETGKVCYNEMQVDLHKKRVPEAQTFNEKTIADLKTERDAKSKAALSGGGDPMETEEDMLLRQAGKAPKGKGKATEPAGPPVVTKETVDQLIEMGFTELRAQKALVRTSNTGLEQAITWLTEHLEDADIDDPLSAGADFVIKTQEELGQEEAERLAGSMSNLSEAEKKAKLDELLTKARAKKAGTTVEEEKQKERARRQGGQQTVKSKRELEEAQRKREAEARKKEKREFELERQRLREKIAAEKAEKLANGTMVSAVKNEATAALLKEQVAADKAAEAKAKAEIQAAHGEGGASSASGSAAKKPKTEREIEAENALLAKAGILRNYDEEAMSTADAMAKLSSLGDVKAKPALDMLAKMMANVQKAPAEAKFRKIRLSNPKIAEAVVFVPGARQFMRSIGWQLVESEYFELPVEGDGVAQAAAQVQAVEQLTAAVVAATKEKQRLELEARKKEAAEKAAKAKAEKEALKAAMARDRAEVAARGPAQASVARKLGDGGTQTSAIFQQQEEEEGKRNAQ